MLLELHSHTCKYSKCSFADPVELVKKTVFKHLQGLVITEHGLLWKDQELIQLRIDAELSDNFLLFSGQEVSTDIGHVLVFGAKDSISESIKLKDLRQKYPDACLIWAHPFRGGNIPKDEIINSPLLDAIEILSSNHSPKENYLGISFWHKYKFTAVSGTDTHDLSIAGKLPTQFDHPVYTMEDIVREIRAGRCRPFLKEIPKAGSNLIVTELTLGTKGEDEIRDRIIVKQFIKDNKWEKARSTAVMIKELQVQGFDVGNCRIPKLIDINDQERLIIEEGQRGKSLFDLLILVNKDLGADYIKMAAVWLAKFHKINIKIAGTGESLRQEKKRIINYRKAFIDTNSPYRKKIEPVIDFVWEQEEEILLRDQECFIQAHGDFHPKNIIIGQDRLHDLNTRFVSVIDFDSSLVMPLAFDVGYFLSQLRTQLGLKQKDYIFNDNLFLETYLDNIGNIDKKIFLEEVELFKLRAYLSIATFLIKVGKGQSPEMEELISLILQGF